MSATTLDALARCFHGIIPSGIATADAAGAPNITFLSHVDYVDASHVALSCQFFNKTRTNIAENPYASVKLIDPLTLQGFRLELEYEKSLVEGPLFDRMKTRIDAIAAHTGLLGVFRLLSADIYKVLEVLEEDGFVDTSLPDPIGARPESGPLTELRGLQTVSGMINSASSLASLFSGTLEALHSGFGFGHSMLLVVDETEERLFAVESYGYGGGTGVGAEVRVGEGLIGLCAQTKKPIRIVGMASDLRYGRAIADRAQELGHSSAQDEIPLPGLPDAQSQLALPLVVGPRLLGVLVVESSHPLRFEYWHEAYLELITNQVALALERMMTLDEKEAPEEEPQAPSTRQPQTPAIPVLFYENDDCIFVNGEYLIRNLPGKILWRILSQHQTSGRTEFTNRELRLDTSLKLPAIKDNLESRLILLRKRLEAASCGIRLVPLKRGRFALELDGPLALDTHVPLPG